MLRIYYPYSLTTYKKTHQACFAERGERLRQKGRARGGGEKGRTRGTKENGV
jgi:hypothetical protein